MSHFPRHAEYKNSGNKWIGDIPSHWHVTRYKNLMRERGELSKTGNETLMSVSAYTGVTTRAAILEEGEIHTRADSLVGYKKCAPDDLVVNIMLAWNRGLGFSKQHGIVSPAYCVFKKTNSFDSRFLNYLVRDDTSTSYYKSFSTGLMDSRLRLYPETLLALQCALPNIDEQGQIADFLDRETTRIDSLIEKKTRFIELLKEKRQAVITKAVTKGIDPSVPMRDSGVKWLGNVPAHWHVSPLKHYLDRNDGGVWGDEPTSETDTIVLRSTEQAVDGSWQIIDPARRKLSSSEISKSLLQEGDLLVTKSSGSEQHIGKTSLVTEDVAKLKACYSNFMQRLRVSHKTTPEFVALILNNRIAREQLAYQSNSTTGLANLTAGMIGEVKCCFPPLHEQNELIKNIHANTTPLDLLSDKTNRSIELLKEHRSALITAAITGKIDVRISK